MSKALTRLLATLLGLALTACSSPEQPAAGASRTQGFAGLGTRADAFTQVDPDGVIRFPADHGAHPGFRIEWWYVTANLKDSAGNRYGAQWTLFRQALAPVEETADGWQDGQVWMAHTALTSAEGHWHGERFGRRGGGQSGVTMEPGFRAWLDDWSLQNRPDVNQDPLDRITLAAKHADFSYTLDLTAQGPLVRHGQQGYSTKSGQGQASWYYSQPFYQADGLLSLPGQASISVTGSAWLDREWSSQPLAPDQAGWDWFSLQLESGARLMLFQLRSSIEEGPYYSGTWIAPDGTATALGPDQIRMTPLTRHEVAGRTLPVTWQLSVAGQGLQVQARAVNPDAWMDGTIPYWEGPVTVSGSHAGQGYLEMTGYPVDR